MVLRLRRITLAVLFVTAFGSGAASAQTADAPLHFVVHPADAPVPALRYRLLPPLLDQQPGNAAVWYGKVTAEQQPFFTAREMWEAIDAGADLPLEEVVASEQLQKATRDNSIFRHLERAARSEYVDWQLPIRDRPYYSMLLPEVQQTRAFSRLLAVRTRRQIAERDFEGAVRTLQSGFALARHVAEGQTLVNALVGFAESRAMSNQIRDFVQQPGAPNLYWALTALPDPLVDPRPGIEAELAALELTLPVLQDLTHSEYGEQYWREQLQEVWQLSSNLAELQADHPVVLLAVVVRGYPIAKQGLLDAGWSPERLEQMPVSQVVLAYSMMQYERRRDEQLKWLFVPYPGSDAPQQDAGISLPRESWDAEILPLSRAFSPGFKYVRYAAARAQREIAILRLVEAIRMYGARHNGALPDSLEAIREAPIPLDPVNGKPFQYRVEEQTAIIEGPPVQPAGFGPLRVEIQFAPVHTLRSEES